MHVSVCVHMLMCSKPQGLTGDGGVGIASHHVLAQISQINKQLSSTATGDMYIVGLYSTVCVCTLLGSLKMEKNSRTP